MPAKGWGDSTLKVKTCVAFGKSPLAAVTSMVKGEPVAFGGVPLITPVVWFNVAQPGRPIALNVTARLPDAVSLKLSACPTAKVALVALVMEVGWLKEKLKVCVALGAVPLLAVIVTGLTPTAVGVPLITPVDDRVRPVGRVPEVTLNVAAG